MAEQVQATAILDFKTNTYARNVYRYGVNRLTAREGFTGVPAEYYIPVEQRAAEIYTDADILLAFNSGWINEQEYNETMTYKLGQ